MLLPAQWEVTKTPAKEDEWMEGTEKMLKALNSVSLDGFEGDWSSGVEALSQHSTKQLQDIVNFCVA